jgi:hypothetical protein
MTGPERGASLGGRPLLLLLVWMLAVLALGVAEALLRPGSEPELRRVSGRPAAPRVIRVQGQVVPLATSPTVTSQAKTAGPARRTGTE